MIGKAPMVQERSVPWCKWANVPRSRFVVRRVDGFRGCFIGALLG